MENKINVAELLRKCPEGMELDCTLFSRPLKYSGLKCPRDIFPIRTVAENGEIIWFTKEGCAHDNMYPKDEKQKLFIEAIRIKAYLLGIIQVILTGVVIYLYLIKNI